MLLMWNGVWEDKFTLDASQNSHILFFPKACQYLNYVLAHIFSPWMVMTTLTDVMINYCDNIMGSKFKVWKLNQCFISIKLTGHSVLLVIRANVTDCVLLVQQELYFRRCVFVLYYVSSLWFYIIIVTTFTNTIHVVMLKYGTRKNYPR